MGKELIVPNNFVIDNNCTDLIIDNVCNRIKERQEAGENKGIDIYIQSNYFRVRYNHKIYKVGIVKENDKLLWYLSPFNKSYFTTPAKGKNSFDIVIHAIKEHDENFKKQKEVIEMKVLKISSLVVTVIVSLFSTTFIPKNNEEVILTDSHSIVAEKETIVDEVSDIPKSVVEEVKEVETTQPKVKVESKPITTTTTKTETPKETKSISNEPKYRTDIASTYEGQINAYRVSKGLLALPITSEAKSEANMRAMQLISNYSHNSSEGFGENIGNGTANVYNFVDAWKDSPVHNATILRDQAITFAVSVVEYNDRWYTVASFKMDYSMYE